MEQAVAGGQTTTLSNLFNGAGTVSTRGWAGDFTVWSADINLSSTLGTRINARNYSTRLVNALTKATSASRANTIIKNLFIQAARTGAWTPKYRIVTLGEFYNHSGMTPAEFKKVADKISTTTSGASLPGLINVNTAPAEVLMTLPGLTSSDATAIVSQRANESDMSTIGWVFDALSPTKAAGILNSITARSWQYSADIVAVSADGRAFKRVKVVVDGTPVNNQVLPAKIVFRRDLTSLGWPLDPAIRTALRAGEKLPPPAAGTGPGETGNLGLQH
jgi:DNA uptake protein ComE-like DNA-binding protein